ncbi:MAG TPA: hypothetical protein VIG04_11860 [Gemmatimonadales bacterium]|jgi:Cu2+-exporting ATPase
MPSASKVPVESWAERVIVTACLRSPEPARRCALSDPSAYLPPLLPDLRWAAGYNIVAIPLAAGVLAGRGILLSPALAAGFMSLSTVIVAVNAQLLRRVAL